MKTFKIPFKWALYAEVDIEAETLEDAVAKAEEMSIPNDGQYCDDSMNIDWDTALCLNPEESDSREDRSWWDKS